MKILVIILGLFISLFSTPKNVNNYQNTPVYTVNSVQIRDNSDDFISYWKNDFRKNEKGEIIPICDITKEQFNAMYYDHYVQLTISERAVVNAVEDYEEGYTIKDSIDQLASMYTNGKSKTNTRSNLDQPTSIIVVVSIAIFGMTSISIFFIFKQKKFIK